MKINLSKTFVFTAAAVVLAASLALAQNVSAAPTAPPSGGSNDYIEIPLNYTRVKPKMKVADVSLCWGAGDVNHCKDVETGVGMYNYVGGAPAPTRANVTSITVITMEGSPTNRPTDTNPPFEVVGGVLRVYGLAKGKDYKISYSYDDAKSADIQNILKNQPKYCNGGEPITFVGDYPGINKNGPEFQISQHLANGCSRYNTAAFLPAAVLGASVNGGEPFTYTGGVMTLTSTSMAASNSNTEAPATSEDTGDDCPLARDAPLRWLGCPVIALGAKAVQGLQEQIQNFLYTPVSQIFDNDDFKATANTFRNVGIALILAAGLVMIISQALGMEFVDAYTIRKVMPRLAAALILMVVAWPLLRVVVTFFNDLGLWSSGLIDTVSSNVSTDANDAGATGGILAIVFGSVAAFTAIAVLGAGGIVSFLFTILLALFIGFIVLAIRQMVILVAILFAPLAIAAYVLPGTQKIWNFWRQALLTALMMFPIIMVFLASGKALSTLLSAANSTELSLLAVFVYFAPYFLLPFAFKLAGGLMSTIFSIANDRSRGLFDRGKKYRQGKVAQNTAAMKAGNRFNNRPLNTMTARATTGRMGFGKRGRAAYEQKMALSAYDFAKSPEGQSIQFNDPALRAMSYGSAAEARANMGRDWGLYKYDADGNLAMTKAEKDKADETISSSIAAVKANGGFGSTRQVWATKQLAATGTGFDDSAQMYAAIARASGGNLDLAQSMWGEMRGTSERAGRGDLKAGYSGGANLLSAIHTSGARRTDEIRTQYADNLNGLGVEAARGFDNMSIMRQKPAAIRNIMGDLERGQQRLQTIVEDPNAAADDREKAATQLGQIRAKMENMQEYKSYGPEINSEYVHGRRDVVITERDAEGRATHATTVRDAGVERSAAAIDYAQESAAAGYTSAQSSYVEERQRRLSPEEARRVGMDAPTPGPGDES